MHICIELTDHTLLVDHPFESKSIVHIAYKCVSIRAVSPWVLLMTHISFQCCLQDFKRSLQNGSFVAVCIYVTREHSCKGSHVHTLIPHPALSPPFNGLIFNIPLLEQGHGNTRGKHCCYPEGSLVSSSGYRGVSLLSLSGSFSE